MLRSGILGMVGAAATITGARALPAFSPGPADMEIPGGTPAWSPLPPAPLPPALISGVPGAPGLPSGVAENSPARLPLGTAIGPAGRLGFSPSAISRSTPPSAPPGVFPAGREG